MQATPSSSAWAGTLGSFVATPADFIFDRLVSFLPDAGRAQHQAWRQELGVLQEQGAQVIEVHPPSGQHGTVLEYMLPKEAGRRPDVLVLQDGRLVVLEFKQGGLLRHVDLDQTQAYARDLANYHSACADIDVIPVLVLCGAGAPDKTVQGVRVVPASKLASILVELAREAGGAPMDLASFLAGVYAPLPSLVAAARLLFENLELPQIRRAHSAGVNDAVELVLEKATTVREAGGRQLVLLTGVPGAGKTLVGLQVVHSAALEAGFRFGSRRERGAPATFLSGNGPLVQVLQAALQSRAFVQDMHRYIREYGLEHPERVPLEQLIVFDEAQRAWDGPKIEDFYADKLKGRAAVDLSRSEPDLLIEVAGRIEGGALVFALVGTGQEIHTGEEGGVGQWAAAIARAPGEWIVTGPASLAPLFASHGVGFAEDDRLDLDTGLRAHAAMDLHRWVELVLDEGDFDAAAPLAAELRQAAFPIYVTRDLSGACSYARERFGGEQHRRFGVLASSKARNLGPHDLDPGFQATKRIRIGNWFNDDPESARSCCQLVDVVTEFQCQGLELDLPIVCWGDDFWWQGSSGWVSRPARRNRLVHDPHRLRVNAYRVLLTRGREGLVIFVPPEPAARMDPVLDALVSAGALLTSGR